MFSSLKKSKTLRSLLGAAAFFAAGAPSVVQAVPKAPQQITQSATKACDQLAAEYAPICEQLEGNVPYCYVDKGAITTGCGVHLKDFKSVKKLEALKVTPKKGKRFLLKNKEYLKEMAGANWYDNKTYLAFPEVEEVEIIKVEDCQGKCPKNTAVKWEQTLFLMPEETLKKINQEAIRFHVKNAYECHPNLFAISPSLRLVVVDLIYNLGYEKYKSDFPKFQEAVRKNNIWQAREHSLIKNNTRRTSAHQILIDSARLCEARCMDGSSQKTFDELKELVNKRKKEVMTPSKEKAFWRTVAECTQKNYAWFQTKSQKAFLRRTAAQK